MSRKSLHLIILVALVLGGAAQEAAAWGPKAQQAIAQTSLVMLRRTLPQAMRSENIKYDADLFKGAADSYGALDIDVTAISKAEAMEVVGQQIALLRTVRKYGVGSYFSYRMGVLSSLVSDLVLPYSLAAAPADTAIRSRMEDDIDAHVGQLTYQPKESREIVDNPGIYFTKVRDFFDEARDQIGIDYASGTGYDGYLSRGVNQFFGRAVNATADVWYTVMMREASVREAPSPAALTNYFVNELVYLLEEGNKVKHAEDRYAYFEQTNPGLTAYERVGDAFYAAGATDRAVAEWRKALQQAGDGRDRVNRKLANHFLEKGRELLAAGLAPGADENFLPQSIEALEQVPLYDRTNGQADAMLKEARHAYSQREARRQESITLLASAERVMREAKAAVDANAPTDAINIYGRALALFGGITDEFSEQRDAAERQAKEAEREISRLTRELITSAEQRIDEGNRAVDSNRFDEAINIFEAVVVQVDDIPAAPGSETATSKDDLIQKARAGVDRAKTEKIRFEQQMQAQAAAGGTA